MKNFIVTAAIFLAVLCGLAYIILITNVSNTNLGSTDFNRFEKAESVGSVTVSSVSSTLVLANNPARRYAIITNTGTNFVCLSLAVAVNTPRTATNCTGIYLPANGGTYIIDADNLYTGPITGIANSANVVVGVAEVE